MTRICVSLSRPIKGGDGKELSELVFDREATLADLIAAERTGGGGIAMTAAVAASMLDLPLANLHAMSATDFRKLDKALQGVVGNDLGADGAEPSS